MSEFHIAVVPSLSAAAVSLSALSALVYLCPLPYYSKTFTMARTKPTKGSPPPSPSTREKAKAKKAVKRVEKENKGGNGKSDKWKG